MKKYLAIILALLMLLLPACGGSNNEQGENTGEAVTETRLDPLADSGWTASGSGYSTKIASEYSEAEYIATLEGNTLKLEIQLNYQENNEKMLKSYKENDSLAAELASRMFTDIEGITGQSFDELEYVAYVGGTECNSGKLTGSAAEELAQGYDD